MGFKLAVRTALARLGYDVRRFSGAPGRDPFMDMKRMTGSRSGTVVVDAGANTGQTLERMLETFHRPVIHAFEPGPSTFLELRSRIGKQRGIHLNDCALGAQTGIGDLIENSEPEMSSLLEPGPDAYGRVTRRVPVRIETLDDYCSQNGVDRVDILKSDTQGFDLQVLRGAQGLLDNDRVGLVFIEINFGAMYKGQSRFDEIYAFLTDRAFELVTFYELEFRHGKASWTDALFVQPRYRADSTNR